MKIATRESAIFVVTAALGFAACAAVTIAWCASMSSMPGMEMPGGWTMSMTWMRMPGQGWPGAAANFLGMWIVMMIAMMLPALLPALRRLHPRGGLMLRVAAGYYAAWLLLGFALFPMGVALAELAMRHAGLARLVPALSSLVLIVAGALQCGAWKSRALAGCRARATCCDAPFRDPARAPRHGFKLGLHCLRCCAPWTAALLALGVMDLPAMAWVTAAVGAERLLPRGEMLARWSGLALLVCGVLGLTNT